MNNNNKLSIVGIIGLILAIVLGGVAIATALRMSSQPSVSPTVPQTKPQASELTRTPACGLTFTVAELPVLKCDSVTIVPSDTVIVRGEETRKLTATANGGLAPLTYSWNLTSNNSTIGILSSSTGQNVTWTAPSSLNASQTWTIVATVTDSGSKTATSDSCKVTLNYTNNPSCNSTCQNSSDCPNDLACSSGRCRNPSCTDSSDCKCPPPPKVCNDTCLVNSECSTGLICAGGNCRNPSCITQSGCTCPTTTPPPVVVVTPQTHRECRNNACVVINGAGTDTCTSDVSCAPVAVAPKIPESGVELPTILGIVGGAGLLLLGFLIVL